MQNHHLSKNKLYHIYHESEDIVNCIQYNVYWCYQENKNKRRKLIGIFIDVFGFYVKIIALFYLLNGGCKELIPENSIIFIKLKR